MQREKDCHLKNNTFGPVVSDPQEKPIPADWVFRIKHRGGPINLEDLDEKQYKARVVIRGQFMKAGVNFNDTFAPVAKPTSLRALLAVATKYSCLLYAGDVETAFLTAKMDCTVLVIMPPFWGKKDDPVAKANVHKETRFLLKGVPGIPQGSRLFYQTFSDYLISVGYLPIPGDKCVFINRALKERNAVLLWVDDFIYLCESESLRATFIDLVRRKFTVPSFQPLRTFLGMEIIHNVKLGTMQLNQATTTRVLLERAQMTQSNAVNTPVVAGAIFSKTDCPADASTNTSTTEFRSLIALLNFISCWTRPDITFIVNKLCKFMSNPGELHWKMLKHLLRYMGGTIEHGLFFSIDKSSSNPLIGYSDSSFGDCPDSGRSTLAYVFLYHGCVLSWFSKLNTYVTLSTNQSEYSALALAGREAEWIISILNDIDYDVPITPVPILVDNAGVVSLVFNPVEHQSNKHVKLSSHYARELTDAKVIFPKKVASESNLADIFTKPLPNVQFKHLSSKLVMSRSSVVPETAIAMMLSDTDPDSDSDANILKRSVNNYYYMKARTTPESILTVSMRSHGGITPCFSSGNEFLGPP